MSRVEVMNRIEELEHKEFMIHMIDRWTARDRQMLEEVKRELEVLRAMVN